MLEAAEAARRKLREQAPGGPAQILQAAGRLPVRAPLDRASDAAVTYTDREKELMEVYGMKEREARLAAAHEAAHEAAKVPAAPGAPATEASLKRGDRVLIHSLKGRAELNGKSGSVMSFDEPKGRYAVRVGKESILLKSSNLEELTKTNDMKGFLNAQTTQFESPTKEPPAEPSAVGQGPPSTMKQVREFVGDDDDEVKDVAAVDERLWSGAVAQGWRMHTKGGGRYLYVTPSGECFETKSEALEYARWAVSRSAAPTAPAAPTTPREAASVAKGVVDDKPKGESSGVATDLPTFIAAPTFGGARDGMVFKLGSSGIGYYTDPPVEVVPGAGAVDASAASGNYILLVAATTVVVTVLAVIVGNVLH